MNIFHPISLQKLCYKISVGKQPQLVVLNVHLQNSDNILTKNNSNVYCFNRNTVVSKYTYSHLTKLLL